MESGKGKQHELLSNEEFLKSLAALFESTSASKSSIWLTHKRLTYEDGADPGNETQGNDPLGTSKEYPCLLRATDGKSRTISTHIAPSSLPSFQAQYGTLLKATMTQTLRKRDKKKEKARVEAAALKKKKIMEGVLVEGPKRGKGRRKRERLEKVKVRLEEARRKLEEKEKQGKRVVLSIAHK